MTKFSVSAAAGLVVAAAGIFALRAQDPVELPNEPTAATEPAPDLPVSDPSCTFFGPEHDKFVLTLSNAHSASHLTEQVVSKLGTSLKGMTPADNATALFPSAPGGSRTDAIQNPAVGIIDKYIFQQMADQGVAPAPPTTDYEFLRRVTLDLTGRIPTPTEVVAFVNNTDPNKRATTIDALIATPQWVDKWTIWLADHFQNNSTNSFGANRFIQGVVKYNDYIRASLQANKPYNVMAKEMIAATGTNSYQQGELNALVGAVMGGGPLQDVFDAQTAFIAERYLGLAHVNCLLCHNGKGHLDSISLWGYYKTRNDAWGMASFLSHTASMRIPVTTAAANPYYWALQDNIASGVSVDGVINRTNYTIDYQLNTTTGNRPSRVPASGVTTGRVAPVYITNGATPPAGSGAQYRTFLANQVTGDFLFAQATVNYVWEYFFGIGIVSPSNQLDPMRLDPDNPPSGCPLPTSPCTLQASHPRLLNELAQSFINNNYDLKKLMRDMVTSRAYQLSSRYDGTWNSANDRLFARKLVRRLWSEEIHDAITQSYGVPVTYTNANWNPTTVSFAMQLPEPLNTPNGTIGAFLNAFLRGDRDLSPRRGDSSITQALNLMNDTFVTTRVNTTTNNNTLIQAMKLADDQAVSMLYLNVLSRYPSATELATGVANFKNAGNATARAQEGRTLLWSLYNKVDFMFNY